VLEKQATHIDKIDPRVRRTRQMLQQSMSELLKEKEFVDITVQDITERADLNRATFYKHFLDKYELLDVIVREDFQTLLDAALPEKPVLSPETIGILIQTAFKYLAGFHGSCQMVRIHSEQALMMQQVQHQIYENLLRWLQPCAAHTGLRHEDKATEIVALLTSWTIFGPTLQVACRTVEIPEQALIDQVTALAHAALADYLIHITDEKA
jgi:AcrR family transcriptional regulator